MCPSNEPGAVVDTEPLIQPDAEEDKDECDDIDDTIPSSESLVCGIFDRPLFNELTEDVKSLGRIVCPTLTMTLLLHSKSVISMLFLGHIGDAELAGGALALSFANITGFSVIKGMSMGMEPICSQAFGARRLSVMSQAFQRTLCLLLVTAILISFLWLNMEPILLFLGQDKDIIEYAKVYLRFSIPELIAQVCLHPLRSFLRTQYNTTPLTVATTIGLLLHLPINLYFVNYLGWGVKGVALATACNTINLDLGIVIYLLCSNIELKPWDGLTIVSPFQGWKKVLSLAIPSVLSVCLEWWWYEIMLILCGLLKDAKASVAAMGILIQTTGLVYVFPHALSMGLSTRIGHELGAGQPIKAKRLAIIGLVIAVIMGVIAFGFTLAVRSVWGKMYTSEDGIVSLITLALPVLGFCEIGNCPQTAACGVLTGSARTKLGAKINFVAFYLVGLPVAVAFAFWFQVGFLGLWFGLAASQAACMGMMIYSMINTDWRLLAKRSDDLTQDTNQTQDLDLDLETALLSD